MCIYTFLPCRGVGNKMGEISCWCTSCCSSGSSSSTCVLSWSNLPRIARVGVNSLRGFGMTMAGGDEDLAAASMWVATGIVAVRTGLGCLVTLDGSNSRVSCCTMVFDMFLSDFFFLNSFIIWQEEKEREKERRHSLFTVHCLNRVRE